MSKLSFAEFAALWIADEAAIWLLQHFDLLLVALGLIVLVAFVFTSASIE